jgi:hypothetical protein
MLSLRPESLHRSQSADAQLPLSPYRALVDAFRKSPPRGDGARLVNELDRVVTELERVAAPEL